MPVKGFAKSVRDNLGDIPFDVGQKEFKEDIYVPTSGGFPHIHVYGDGCKLSHISGIAGTLVDGEYKNAANMTYAIGELERILRVSTDRELGQSGGRQHFQHILGALRIIDRLAPERPEKKDKK